MNRCQCKIIGRRLVEYADGELDKAQASEVADHLGRCASCRQTLDEYRTSLHRVYHAIGKPPAGTVPTLLAVEQRAAGIQRKQLALSLSALAAAACLCLLAGTAAVIHFRETSPAVVERTAKDGEIETLKMRLAELEDQIAEIQAAYTTRPVSDIAQIEYEGVAAICVAAGINLDENIGDADAALKRYWYAVETFPQTAAAEKERKRISKLTNTTI